MMEITSKTIRDRIVELQRVAARDLVPNPKNWRRHPARQAAALRGVLQEIVDVTISRWEKLTGKKAEVIAEEGDADEDARTTANTD
jgi:hypothetical protein